MSAGEPNRGAADVIAYLAHFSRSICALSGADAFDRAHYSAVFSRRAMFNRLFDREWPSAVDESDVADAVTLAGAEDVRPVWIIDESAFGKQLLGALRTGGFVEMAEWIGMTHPLESISEAPLAPALEVAEVKSEQALRAWAEVCAASDGYSAAQLETFAELFLTLGWEKSGWTHLVVFSGERPLATASMLRIGKLAAIDWVNTRPEARRNGIAGHLTATLLQRAKSERCTRVVLTSTAHGESVYQRLGFRECTRVRAFRLS